MPTYDYKCPSCPHVQELFHKVSESPSPSCPSCGTVMKKMPGRGAGLSFSGSGFYATDYAEKPAAQKPCCPCGKNANSCGSSS